MRHYVLTAASRGPDYPLDANRRRIALLRGVTARSLAVQETDWTWLVYVHPDDPLRDERLDAFRSAGAPVVTVTDPTDAIDWSGPVLTTRIDDDDAFAPDAFRRLHRAAATLRERRALMFPVGVRTWAGRMELVRHGRNAWVSLFAPAGDRTHVRAVQHQRMPRFARIRFVDERLGWLWVRHGDTNSGSHLRADRPLSREIRDLFPIDWALVA